jgi:hypothetical protein
LATNCRPALGVTLPSGAPSRTLGARFCFLFGFAILATSRVPFAWFWFLFLNHHFLKREAPLSRISNLCSRRYPQIQV